MKFVSIKNLISILWILNILVACVVFSIASKINFADARGYLLMAESINHGKFSSWYLLSDYYPEILRTPGYPLFICLLKHINSSDFFIKVIQLCFYFLSLFLGVKILDKITSHNKVASAIFLSLTLVNIQLPFYAGFIGSDSMNIFFVILFIYILIVKEKNYKNAILLGLAGGVAFQLRPAFIFFPFLLLSISFLFYRANSKYFLIQLFVFALTLLPFSFWNLNNHGVFKPTPLEGGGGVAHLGFWSFKLPKNYTEHFQWGNNTGNDLLNPFYFTNNERTNFKNEYEKEWKSIVDSIKPNLSHKDSININIMKSNPSIFVVYNSKFTIAREKLLWQKLTEHAKDEPYFYFKTRIYTFCRVYFTGINADNLAEAHSVKDKMKIIYPFIITFFSVFIGLLFFFIFILKNKFKVNEELVYIFFLCLYFGAVHIPFAIQGRFTVPVHLLVFILDAYLIAYIFKKINKNKEALN